MRRTNADRIPSERERVATSPSCFATLSDTTDRHRNEPAAEKDRHTHTNINTQLNVRDWNHRRPCAVLRWQNSPGNGQCCDGSRTMAAVSMTVMPRPFVLETQCNVESPNAASVAILQTHREHTHREQAYTRTEFKQRQKRRCIRERRSHTLDMHARRRRRCRHKQRPFAAQSCACSRPLGLTFHRVAHAAAKSLLYVCARVLMCAAAFVQSGERWAPDCCSNATADGWF